MPLFVLCHTCSTPLQIPPSARHIVNGNFCSRRCQALCHRSPAKRLARFWARVAQCAHAHPCQECCWLWHGKRDADGYGTLWITLDAGARRYLKAHRVAWALATTGAFLLADPALVIRHQCNCKTCVNPSHLLSGTPQDNVADAVRDKLFARGRRHGSKTQPSRTARGERHGAARLTNAIVRAIRADFATGTYSQRALARKYALGPSHVHGIVHGTLWRHIL